VHQRAAFRLASLRDAAPPASLSPFCAGSALGADYFAVLIDIS
jgi:hypothetical protein